MRREKNARVGRGACPPSPILPRFPPPSDQRRCEGAFFASFLARARKEVGVEGPTAPLRPEGPKKSSGQGTPTRAAAESSHPHPIPLPLWGEGTCLKPGRGRWPRGRSRHGGPATYKGETELVPLTPSLSLVGERGTCDWLQRQQGCREQPPTVAHRSRGQRRPIPSARGRKTSPTPPPSSSPTPRGRT